MIDCIILTRIRQSSIAK